MRILIVEDEPPIADDLAQKCVALLGVEEGEIRITHTLEDAAGAMSRGSVDLCLLDLNLNGEDGFHLLQQAVSRSFHTIIISAHTDQALKAYEFGVLDFVPKPFTEERLTLAFNRFLGRSPREDSPVRNLVVRRGRDHIFVSVEQVVYFQADRYLVEAHLADGRVELLDKPLRQLEQILPGRFLRIHRSFMVCLDHVLSFQHRGGGVYQLKLENGVCLPVSRRRIRILKERLTGG